MNFPAIGAMSHAWHSQLSSADSSRRARFAFPDALDASGEVSSPASIFPELQRHDLPGGAQSTASANPANSPQVAKVRKAAGEFEAMLLQNWWGSMKESGFGGDDDSSDPGKDTLDQLGMQAMCAAVAKGGGLGIAAILVQSVLSKAGESEASQATGSGSGIAANASNAKI